MSKSILSAPTATASFAQQLKDVETTAAETCSKSGRKLGRTEAGLERIREAAAQTGFEEGHAEGFAKGQEAGMMAIQDAFRDELRRFAEAMHRAEQSVIAAIETWCEASEPALARLSATVAAQILTREISLSEDAVLGFVREAIREVALSDHVRIRVNPFDSEVVRKHKQELLSIAPSVRAVDVVDDPAIQGGCLIESDGGVIDASIETRLRLVLDAFREAA